MQINIR